MRASRFKTNDQVAIYILTRTDPIAGRIGRTDEYGFEINPPNQTGMFILWKHLQFWTFANWHSQFSEGWIPAKADIAEPPDAELRWILGRPNFTVAGIAETLRKAGRYTIARKAEDEQACALHWMLNLYLKHGPELWRDYARKELEEMDQKSANPVPSTANQPQPSLSQ